VGLKIAKRFKFGDSRQVEVAANVYNLFNGGNFLGVQPQRRE